MALKDLFRPAWKHSNASVRRQAVQGLPDQDAEALIEVATTDPEADIRLLAAKRLTQESQLVQLVTADPGDEVLELVNSRLNGLWRDMIVASPSADECLSLLDRINDEAVLADIASKASEPEVRLSAIQRLRSQRLLCQVAETPCGKEPGEAAVEKITEKELLERLTRKGANKVIRRLAEERLNRIESMAHEPTPEDLTRLQLDELSQEARKLADSWNWPYARKRFLEIKQEWKRLDPNFQHPSHDDVEAGRGKLEERYLAFQERQARERELADARQEVLEQQEELLDQLEDLLEDTTDEAVVKRGELAEAWANLPELPGDDPSPHEPEFRNYLTQHEEACNIARQDRAAKEQLEELAGQAEQLAAGDPADDKTEKKLKQLIDDARSIKLQHDNPGPWRSRIQQAAELFKESREKHLQAVQEAHRQQQAYLESLCDQLEQLLELDDWRDAIEQQKGIKQVWREAPHDQVHPKVYDGIQARYEKANLTFGKWLRQRRDEEKWERWANTDVKEGLIREIEALDAEPDPLKIAETVKAAQAKWKDSGPVPRREAEELWQRFRTVCDRQYAKVKAYYKERDAQQKDNLKAKREIAERAAVLQDSTEWEATAAELKQLQDTWEEIGPAPRREEEEVYHRFRSAGDAFFERLRQHNEEEAAIRLENQEEKERLCEQAEALADSTDWWDTFADLKRLQAQWKALGAAPSEAEKALWERFQTATQAFFERLDAKRPEHLAAKQKIVQEAQAAIEAADAEDAAVDTADTLKDLQAKWKEIGPAPQEEEQALWLTFKTACDAFFEARRERYQEMLEAAEEKMGQKRKLVEQAQKLQDSRDWDRTAKQLQALQAEWQGIGSVPFREDRELYQQFRAACNHFFAARDEYNARRHDERYQNLHRKEEICARIDFINGDTESAGTDNSTLSVADQLKLAIEENFVLGVESGDRRSAAHYEVKKLQAEWRDIGEVPRKYEQSLWRRYRAALDKFYGNK